MCGNDCGTTAMEISVRAAAAVSAPRSTTIEAIDPQPWIVSRRIPREVAVAAAGLPSAWMAAALIGIPLEEIRAALVALFSDQKTAYDDPSHTASGSLRPTTGAVLAISISGPLGDPLASRRSPAISPDCS